MKEEVIELINQFKPSSIRSPRVKWESIDFICVTFYIQDFNNKWYKCEYNISKKAIREMW